jgi:hypothetical protein
LKHITDYAGMYRPVPTVIPGVTPQIWSHLRRLKIVSEGLLTKLQFDEAGVRLSQPVVVDNDRFVAGLLNGHLAPKLVCHTIMDVLDDTTDRCTVCNGLMQAHQYTQCMACGTLSRLVHPGCQVQDDNVKSLCTLCNRRCVWCVPCTSWTKRLDHSVCSCGQSIHRSCGQETVSNSHGACGICLKAHHSECFSDVQQLYPNFYICAQCWEDEFKSCEECSGIMEIQQDDCYQCAQCSFHYHNACHESRVATDETLSCIDCYTDTRPDCTECLGVVLDDSELTHCIQCGKNLHKTCTEHNRCFDCCTESIETPS